MKIEDFIKLDDFEKQCEEKHIKIVRDGDYMLLKYDIDADFTDPIVKQSRGIIFKNGEVICKPFDKFCNYGEAGADDIDWASARVQQKIDGSLIKAFYDNGYWHFATSGTICAQKAECGDMTFLDVIHKADNFYKIPFEDMDKEKTYLFELVSPYTRVVIDYPKTHLYHIGTRKLTGEEVNEDIGIEKPKEYDIHTLEDCIKAAEELNPNDEVEFEGFVVVDKDYHRIKVKSPEYILMHRAINNGIVTTERIVKAIRDGNDEVFYNTDITRVKYLEVKYLLTKVEYEFEKTMQASRAYYEEYDFDRKKTAEEIKKMKYPFVGFLALKGDSTSKDILENIEVKKLTKILENEKDLSNN